MPKDAAITHTKAESRYWYPLEHLNVIYQQIVTEIGKGDPAVLEDVGAYIAEADLGGILKPIVAFLSIPRALGRSSFLWPRYDDSGDFKVLEVDGKDKRALLELADYEGGHLHCYIIRSWLKRGTELLGGKDVEVREVKCRWQDGGTSCRWELSWH